MRKVLEAVTAQRSDGHPVREPVLDQSPGRPREQDLATVTGGRDPGGPRDVEAHVVVASRYPLTGIESHPDPDRLGPRPRRELPLRRHGGGDRRGCALEDGEDRVAFRPQLHSSSAADRVPHQPVVLFQDLLPSPPEVLDETRGTLDVRGGGT